MSSISKRLDKVEQAIAPPASNEVRYVWVDGKDDGSAKIAELQAAGFQGQIIIVGCGPQTWAPMKARASS